MPGTNKAVLEAANAAISKGDTEGFLSFCADDIAWTTVGEETTRGKDAVRALLAKIYAEPPEFTVSGMVAEDDMVVALGDIVVDGVRHAYSDVWRFRDGRMVELRAFVVPGQPAD